MKEYNKDEMYMARCIQLAKFGIGNAAPNPMVGSVIVCDDRIIGEGYHRKCGEAHAEVNAVASVIDEELLKKSTMYVSLEPCSHWGRTPPCAELIIRKGIPKVVIGVVDPFSEVSGRGITMLREAGVEVKVGVLEKECSDLNRRFFTFHNYKRPYIILKWAQTEDGFIDHGRPDDPNISPLKISSEISMIEVHKMRSEESAIMVGTNTAIADNPRLNVRKWDGKSPVRVLIDRFGRVAATSALFDGSVPTLVFTENRKNNISTDNLRYIRIDSSVNDIYLILKELASENIQSLIVEGGSKLLQSFIDLGLWDEARVETSYFSIGDGVKAPKLSNYKIIERKSDETSSIYRYIRN